MTDENEIHVHARAEAVPHTATFVGWVVYNPEAPEEWPWLMVDSESGTYRTSRPQLAPEDRRVARPVRIVIELNPPEAEA